MSFFNPRFKLAVHIAELVVVHVVLILAAVRMLAFPAPNFGSRGNTIALGMVSATDIPTDSGPGTDKSFNREPNP
jgi:hypothetical protein